MTPAPAPRAAGSDLTPALASGSSPTPAPALASGSNPVPGSDLAPGSGPTPGSDLAPGSGPVPVPAPALAPALAVSGGFADPVRGAQSVFRAVMEGFARPGRVVPLAAWVAPPAPLPPLAGAVLAALADAATPVFLEAPSEAVVAWLAFHTGAPVTADPAAASFAVIAGATLRLAGFAQGTPTDPDRSATVLALVEGFDSAVPFVLEGPGISDIATFGPVGLPADFRTQWAANGRAFPCGVDVLLVGPDGIAGLPRSTRIRAA